MALWLGLLITGLWPFNFLPSNQVSWVRTGNGLHFERYGQVYSTELWALNESTKTEAHSFTIELWVRPGQTRYTQESVIFCVYDWFGYCDLSISQSGSDLVLKGRFRDGNNTQERLLRLYGAFRNAQPVLATITSGQEGTRSYLNAKLQAPPLYPISPNEYIGRLLLGHAPDGTGPWTGNIIGLALYGRVLSAEEINQDYKHWLSHERYGMRGTRALYVFDEQSGDIVHNRIGSAPDLVIPPKFKPLHVNVLAVPHPFRLHRMDTVINILGFMPFGFLVCFYLRAGKRQSSINALIRTIIAGALTSLGIELLQVFLPSRDSSLLDLINNVVGTIFGAFIEIEVHNRWLKNACCSLARLCSQYE